MQQCLYAGRIAVDEEQRVEFGEAVVYDACSLVFAFKFQTNHARHLLGKCVADDGDAARCATCHH